MFAQIQIQSSKPKIQWSRPQVFIWEEPLQVGAYGDAHVL